MFFCYICLISCESQESEKKCLLEYVAQDYRKRLKDNGNLEINDSCPTLYYNACLWLVGNDTILSISGGDGYEELHQTVPPLPPELDAYYVVDSTRLLKPMVKCQIGNDYVCLYGQQELIPYEYIRKWIDNAHVLPSDLCFDVGNYYRIFPSITCEYKIIHNDSIIFVKSQKLDCIGY